MGTAFLIFLAFVAGLAVTLQGQFMGLMDRALGTRESIFIYFHEEPFGVIKLDASSREAGQNSGITF